MPVDNTCGSETCGKEWQIDYFFLGGGQSLNISVSFKIKVGYFVCLETHCFENATGFTARPVTVTDYNRLDRGIRLDAFLLKDE